MTSPALPILQAELGASRASIAWVLTGVLLTGPIVTPIVARLGEIWDKRRVLLGVLVIVTIGALVSALSASMPMLIAGQMLQGFGLSTVPLAVGIMRETQSVERTKAGNGIMVGAIFGSTALAMLVSGPIADNLHYSWLFWFPFFLLILIIAAVWWLVPRLAGKHEPRAYRSSRKRAARRRPLGTPPRVHLRSRLGLDLDWVPGAARGRARPPVRLRSSRIADQ